MSQHSDLESDAVAWVSQRASRTRLLLGSAGALCGAIVFALGYFAIRERFLEDVGVNVPLVSAGLAFLVAAIPVVAALVGARVIITVQLSRWTRLAAGRFGVSEAAIAELVSIMKR